MVILLKEFAARTKSEAIEKIKGYSDKMLENMIKVVMYPNSETQQHWKGKIKGYLKTISNVKASSKLKERDYEKAINHKKINSKSDMFIEINDFYEDYCDDDSPKKKKYPKFDKFNVDEQAKELYKKYIKTVKDAKVLFAKEKEVSDADFNKIMETWN